MMPSDSKMLLLVSAMIGLFACKDKREDEQTNESTMEAAPEAPAPAPVVPPAPRYLYVSSGACYGGGVTLSPGSNVISRYHLSSASQDPSWGFDYNALGFNDAPASIQHRDDSTLYVLIENSAGRRVETLNKQTLSNVSYLINSNLSSQVRSLSLSSDGGMLISKSSALEKFSSAKARITQGSNPYINAPGGSCATSTSLMSQVVTLSNGMIAFTHAGTSPNNKWGIISANGYASSPDCLAAQTAPATTALPTALVEPTPGHVLVAYGSTTNSSNFIYSYKYNTTTGAISSAVAAYTQFSVINGVSAMTVDNSTGEIFVANATSTYNSIEKFTYDANTQLLTRVGGVPYISSSLFTRCISGLSIGN